MDALRGDPLAMLREDELPHDAKGEKNESCHIF